MITMQWIVVWGACAIGAAALAGIVAPYKNRDYSSWMAWSFLFPPLVLWLIVMPAHKGPRPRQPRLDDLDRDLGGPL